MNCFLFERRRVANASPSVLSKHICYFVTWLRTSKQLTSNFRVQTISLIENFIEERWNFCRSSAFSLFSYFQVCLHFHACHASELTKMEVNAEEKLLWATCVLNQDSATVSEVKNKLLIWKSSINYYNLILRLWLQLVGMWRSYTKNAQVRTGLSLTRFLWPS